MTTALRLVFLIVICSLALFAVPSAATESPGVAGGTDTILSVGSVSSSPVADDRVLTMAPVAPGSVRLQPTGDDVDQESTTTTKPDATGGDGDQESTTTTTVTTTTTKPDATGGDIDQESTTTTTKPDATGGNGDQESTTTTIAVVSDAPVRPGSTPQVSDSQIPLASIAMALLVLASVGAVSYMLVRRRSTTLQFDETPFAGDTFSQPVDAAADRPSQDQRPVDLSTPEFLIGLGEALIDAGASVDHVESALLTIARANGTDGVGVIVLPNALIVSVPDADDVVTEIGAPGRALLRFDQIDDVLDLTREAESGAIGTDEGLRRLAAIRSSPPPYSPMLVLLGHICATAGLAAILHGTWVEIVLAVPLGAVVGAFRLWTRRLGSSYQPFIILMAATAVSSSVFALTRVIDDLLTFPLLIAPLITFLPGALLTIAVLELATGQIVSGASRLASGGLQLLLLALGILAGGQLVGVPAHSLGRDAVGTVAALTPWIGVAAFGIGLVWFRGARSSARVWILLVMYVAYAGQVIGGLFFGNALSAFFGALAMTPVAVLLARNTTAPSPLATFLPGFWLLVPGALGLDGVTRLFGADGGSATGILVTTVTSMVGVSLGILLGLLLVANDPERPWSELQVVDRSNGEDSHDEVGGPSEPAG